MKNRCLFIHSRFYFLVLFCVLGLWPSYAQDSSAIPDNVSLSLIAEKTSVGKNKTLWLGLRAQLAPGWKTYWRSPGVAGYGVRLDWKEVTNIESAQIRWPLPHRFKATFGTLNVYNGDLVLPISVTVADVSKPLQGTVKVSMLVCSESLCVPVDKDLVLNLPAGPGEENISQGQQIHNALDKVPSPKTPLPFQVEDVEVSEGETPPTLQVRLSKPEGFSSGDLPELFMEMKGFFLDAPSIDVSKDHQSVLYRAAVYPDENRTATPIPNLTETPVKLTIGFEGKGFEVEKPLNPPKLSVLFFASLLAIAFLGGLILNIMPCVLPVLSLKILSVMRQGGRDKRHIRQEFMATVAGIVFSFFLLALVEIGLKASGHAFGWGVQFQQPVFVVGLIVVLTIFSASLFGFFEFRLPDIFASLGGIRPHQESLVGSFLEGSLVTLLATPCTAPMVGTALAFSLSRGSLEILSIFLVMGLGLAFPFFLMALFPSLAGKLPKPGKWMVQVKNGLGGLLILTVLWLLLVLKGQIGVKEAGVIGISMGLVLVILTSVRSRSEARKKTAWLVVVLLSLGSLAFSLWPHSADFKVDSRGKSVWRPFEKDRIAEYVKAGKIVFVNVTADWCITCQANKYFALKNQAVLDALGQENVVAMEADWTRHDTKITAYLQSFRQYGIPFYAVYGCRNPEGIFLGQILTPGKVLDALKREQCSSR